MGRRKITENKTTPSFIPKDKAPLSHKDLAANLGKATRNTARISKARITWSKKSEKK